MHHRLTPEMHVISTLSKIPKIFSPVTVSPNHKSNLQLATGIVETDLTIDPLLRNHIVGNILNCGALPDTGHFARTLISFYKASDSKGLQSFIQTFTAGMKFLQTFETPRQMKSTKIGHEDSEIPPSSLPKLEDRSPTRPGPVCEISGDHGPVAGLMEACIFPNISDSDTCDTQQQHLRGLLSCLLNPDMVEKIIDECTMKDFIGTNHFTNGIFMSTACHKAFREFQFCLIPVLTTFTLTQYDVEFHWLDKPPVNALRNFRKTPKLTDNYFMHYSSFRSGDRITFKTVNPKKYPLPDPGLLVVLSSLANITIPMEVNATYQALWGSTYFSEDNEDGVSGQEEKSLIEVETDIER